MTDFQLPTDLKGKSVRVDVEMLAPKFVNSNPTLSAWKFYLLLAYYAQQETTKNERGRYSVPIAAAIHDSDEVECIDDELGDAAKAYLEQVNSIYIEEVSRPWSQYPLFSSYGIERRSDGTWITWSYAPAVEMKIIPRKQWIDIPFDVLQMLTTYSSVALYGIGGRFSKSPTKRTPQAPRI